MNIKIFTIGTIFLFLSSVIPAKAIALKEKTQIKDCPCLLGQFSVGCTTRQLSRLVKKWPKHRIDPMAEYKWTVLNSQDFCWNIDGCTVAYDCDANITIDGRSKGYYQSINANHAWENCRVIWEKDNDDKIVAATFVGLAFAKKWIEVTYADEQPYYRWDTSLKEGFYVHELNNGGYIMFPEEYIIGNNTYALGIVKIVADKETLKKVAPWKRPERHKLSEEEKKLYKMIDNENKRILHEVLPMIF